MRKFWGRQVEIKKIEKKIKDFVESDVPLDINYIGYWGISGVGKSELINRALKLDYLMDMDFLPVVHIDCSIVGKDIIRLYDQIVEKVETVAGTTIFQNYYKCKENNKEIVNEVFRGFVGASIPDIVETAAVAILGPIGCGVKAIKYLPKAASYISSAGLDVINDAKGEKLLEEKLLEALIKDFESISEQKFVIVIDSIEYIENEHRELPQNFFDKAGLFPGISNVLWIALGQNKNAYFEELRPLKIEEYIEDFQKLIKNSDIKGQLEKIEHISKGIPYILQMIYELLQNTSNEMILEESYWDENWNPIFTRIFMNYNNRTLKLVSILSVLRNWDDRLVNNLLSYLRFDNFLKWNIDKDDFSIYQSLKTLPFVKRNGSYFSFSDTVIDFYRKILSNEERIEIYRLSTNYIYRNYNHNNGNQDRNKEINLYLLPWLRELKEDKNCDSLKREIISTLYFILNKFLSFENIFEWKNVVYEIISIAISLDKPELDYKIINYLLFEASCMADTKKIEFCYWLQARLAENEENKLRMEIKLLKSKCVLARTKSRFYDLNLPFGIQYRIEDNKEDLCKKVLKQFQMLDNSCEKVDNMIDCLAEYGYIYERNIIQIEIFLKELVKAMKEQNLVKNTTPENMYRYIYFFESLNLVLYHNNDIMRVELEPFFSAFLELEVFVPESIKGEYYFQVALYQFNRKMKSHEYFIQAKKYTINNRYHKMWVERACANHFISQEKISSEECEILLDSLKYILKHAEEISKWNFNVYLTVYVSLLISNRIYDGVAEIIEYITEDTYSVGHSVKDVDWYCLNFFYFNIINHIIYYMENYSLAMKWIDSLISYSSFLKKDKRYFVCAISLLKYKIHVQYQMDDKTISDSINELKALLYTAEAVIGKKNPIILSARKWVKEY